LRQFLRHALSEVPQHPLRLGKTQALEQYVRPEENKVPYDYFSVALETKIISADCATLQFLIALVNVRFLSHKYQLHDQSASPLHHSNQCNLQESMLYCLPYNK
jgi:hypothetical protein